MIIHGKYTINTEKILGKGQYGIVYDCEHSEIKEELCIVKTNSMDDKLITRESEILGKLKDVNNPNLVRVYDILPIPEKKELYIIMEKCKGGDLKQDIDQRSIQHQYYTTTEVINIITQIINGYKTLFDGSIIHRDMKPANILIENGKIKITDFGMGRVIEDMNKRFPHTKVGTPAYASPQLFLEPNYSSKSDIYSLGIILYQLVFLTLPFKCKSQQELILFLRKLKIEPFQCEEIQITGNLNDKAMIRQLINQMLIYNEEQRISWVELFEKFCQKKVENTDVQQIAVQNVSLYDSMFIKQFSTTKQMFNPEIFKQVAENISKDQNITRSVRLNHLVKLLLAKSHLANQLVWAMIELKQSQLNFLNDFNFILIQTCLIGYRYRIAQNAYGFSQNILDLICDEIRRVYDVQELQRALQEYSIDQSEYSQQVRNQAHIERDESNSQFLFIEKSLIENKTKYNYPTDINNFYRLINIQNNTDYKIYGKWFFYFYRKELKDRFNFYEQQTQPNSILKVLALTQMFLKIDEEFPFEKYLELDPRQVCLPDEPDKPYLIKILKKYRQL